MEQEYHTENQRHDSADQAEIPSAVMKGPERAHLHKLTAGIRNQYHGKKDSSEGRNHIRPRYNKNSESRKDDTAGQRASRHRFTAHIDIAGDQQRSDHDHRHAEQSADHKHRALRPHQQKNTDDEQNQRPYIDCKQLLLDILS